MSPIIKGDDVNLPDDEVLLAAVARRPSRPPPEWPIRVKEYLDVDSRSQTCGSKNASQSEWSVPKAWSIEVLTYIL